MFFLFDFTSWRLTEEDHCFRHVKCKLVCVFMVTVTFSLWMNNKKKIISLYLLIYCCFSVVFCSECDVVIVCTKKKDKNKFPNHDKRYQSSLIFLISSLLSFAYWTKSQKFNNMHTKVLHRCRLIKKNIFYKGI